jgi:hypothetical protein
MRFSGSGAADQHDIALMLEEFSTSEIAHQRLIDRGVVEVELVDLLGQWQLGDRHLVFDRACLLLADLGVQQVADELLGFVLALYGCGDDLVIGRVSGNPRTGGGHALHSVEFQLAHRIQHL